MPDFFEDLSEGYMWVVWEGKWIGAYLYCNITPISALETPDQVTF